MQYYRCEVCNSKGNWIFDDPHRGIIQEINPSVCESCWSIEQELVSRRVDKMHSRAKSGLASVIKQSDLKPQKRILKIVGDKL